MSTEATEAVEKPIPYITPEGNFIIPFAADEKYHYWRGGQTIASTLLEINAPFDVWQRYTGVDISLFTAETPDNCFRCGRPLALACDGTIKVCVKCNRYQKVEMG